MTSLSSRLRKGWEEMAVSVTKRLIQMSRQEEKDIIVRDRKGNIHKRNVNWKAERLVHTSWCSDAL